MGFRRRRHLAEPVCDSFLADIRGKRVLQLLQNISQCPGRFGQCKFHVLCLRQSNYMYSQLLWGNQFCGADVGWIPGAGQSAVSCQRSFAGRVYQPESLCDWHGLELWFRLPRHHQRKQWLFGNHSLRSGHWLGEPEWQRVDQCACLGNGKFQLVRLAREHDSHARRLGQHDDYRQSS